MKKFIAFAVLTILMINTAICFAEDDINETVNQEQQIEQLQAIKVQYNGEQSKFEINPIEVDYTTYVPLRKVLELFDAEISFDEATQNITVTAGDTKIDMTIGKPKVTLNNAGEESTRMLFPPAFINDGVTMVPIWFIPEVVGKHGNLDYETNTLVVIDPEELWKKFSSSIPLTLELLDKINTVTEYSHYESNISGNVSIKNSASFMPNNIKADYSEKGEVFGADKKCNAKLNASLIFYPLQMFKLNTSIEGDFSVIEKDGKTYVKYNTDNADISDKIKNKWINITQENNYSDEDIYNEYEEENSEENELTEGIGEENSEEENSEVNELTEENVKAEESEETKKAEASEGSEEYEEYNDEYYVDEEYEDYEGYDNYGQNNFPSISSLLPYPYSQFDLSKPMNLKEIFMSYLENEYIDSLTWKEIEDTSLVMGTFEKLFIKKTVSNAGATYFIQTSTDNIKEFLKNPSVVTPFNYQDINKFDISYMVEFKNSGDRTYDYKSKIDISALEDASQIFKGYSINLSSNSSFKVSKKKTEIQIPDFMDTMSLDEYYQHLSGIAPGLLVE